MAYHAWILALMQTLEFFKTMIIKNAFSVQLTAIFAMEVCIPIVPNALLAILNDLQLIHVNHVTFLIVSHVVSQ